jgi:prevent-host-death family protein
MKELSATEAARSFSEVLDAVEHRGQSFVITRKGKPVARIAPAKTMTGKALKELLRRFPPDPDWARQIAETRKLLVAEDRHWND